MGNVGLYFVSEPDHDGVKTVRHVREAPVPEHLMKRRLAAILAADVVGYTRLMAADETGTHARIDALLDEVVRPLVAKHGGRIFKLMGDGVLTEFGSVVAAVQCAIDIQRGIAEHERNVEGENRLRLRIGINLGDVIIGDDGDMHGNGINVASRLESIADPDGVFVSRSVRDQIRDRLDFKLEDLGDQRVKNIPRPVRVFRVLDERPTAEAPRLKRKQVSLALVAIVLAFVGVLGGISWWQPWSMPSDMTAAADGRGLTLPDRPSIAVLPFENLSDDTEQGYFADGISEDIIIGLSKVSGIFVIARNSSFAYKGASPEVRQVSHDLGVRYVLSGSVRRAGDNLRVTARLVDALNDNNIWAERYDRQVSDVFAVQSDISKQVVQALSVTLKASEQERLFRPHTTSIAAYELFLRARKAHLVASKANLAEAAQLYEQVIKLDPHFAGGYAGLSTVLAVGARLGLSDDLTADGRRALELAKRAIAVDPDFGWSYVALGGALTVLGKARDAVAAVRKGIDLQPNDADTQLFFGWYLTFAGDAAQGLTHIKMAMRLDPVRTNRQYFFLGVSHLVDVDAKAAIDALKKTRTLSSQPPGLVMLATAYAADGQLDKAKQTTRELLERLPNFDMSTWPFVKLFARAEDRELILQAARAAGIPDSSK
jgi:adenylate cyclase